MRNIRLILITLTIIGITAFLTSPSHAMSSLAQDFLKACAALDSQFPPPSWDRNDLRDAAIEVLDAIEAGSYDEWPLDFCLKAIGYTKYPEDLDRILAYEDEMPDTVVRALKGFPSQRAIEFLIKYLSDKEATMRELAVYSLADIDFRKMDKPQQWKDKVKSEIQNALAKEKEEWLKKDIRRCLKKVEAAKVK